MPSSTPSAADTQGLLRLDNQLCFALYAASLAMTKLYKPLLDRLGLTYPQYLVMLVLWEHGGQTVSELGERLFLDSGTLTPLLKRLQSAGWVVRRRDTTDERRVIVHLTPAGEALREAAVQVPLEVACATHCSLEEIAELRQRLHGLRQRLSLRTTYPAPASAKRRAA
ncbi:MAG: MarR family winged helix-turn-helix transcriptional regulator [Caldimonas sp.]|jgi:DNA-binding MarR family transcriptional regulator|uniref:MarR family winged helix-turn-helix transcriptional regulator n=1 Tax=Caldimonas sp. TaxID=2838790 RepID=UPI00391BE17A